MCTTHDQYICGFYPAMNIIKIETTLVACKHAISLEVCCHTYSALFYLCTLYTQSKEVCLEFTHEYFTVYIYVGMYVYHNVKTRSCSKSVLGS